MEQAQKLIMNKKYPGTIWGLATFFNPKGHKHKTTYYRIFKNNIQRQGLKLLTVECAIKGEPFTLKPDDADILIQVRSDSILWHKERLLNIGLERLPTDCDKIIMLDSDIVFLDDNWLQKTCNLLENYECVKPFRQAIRLSKKSSDKILKEKKYYPNDDYYYKEKDNAFSFGFNLPFNYHYSPILSWAMRKEIFDGIGFYDRMIIGSGDTIMTGAFHKRESPLKNSSPMLDADIKIWLNKINERMIGSMAAQDGVVLHLFHGSRKNRDYYNRNTVLQKYNFNPIEDIKLNKDKCWEWATPKKHLHEALKLYFTSRNENQAFTNCLISIIMNSKIKLRDKTIPMIIGKIGLTIKFFSPRLYQYLKHKYNF